VPGATQSKTDVDKLHTAVDLLPQQKKLEFLDSGSDTVISDIGQINAALDKIGGSYVVSVGEHGGRKLIPGAATGGRISGPGTGTSDTAGAFRLSNDEYVVRAAAAHAVGYDTLDAINAMPGMAAGGRVAPTTSVFVDTKAIGGSLATYIRGLESDAAAVSGGSTSSGANVELGRRISALMFGWTGAEFDALNKLFTRESGWNAYAVNPSSGAYGIPQALGHGHPFDLGDAERQIVWGDQYIAGRYGDPIAAWAHEVAQGWYHNGGQIPGSGNVPIMAQGGEGVINRVGMSQLGRDGLAAINSGASGGSTHLHLTVNTVTLDRGSEQRLAEKVLVGVSRMKANGTPMPRNITL
jgi:hypothetical protein